MGPLEQFILIALLVGIPIVFWRHFRWMGRAMVSRFWPVTVGQIQKGIVDRPVSGSR